MEPSSAPVRRKSTFSGGNGGNCVEVAFSRGTCTSCHGFSLEQPNAAVISVHDSKDPGGPHLHFNAAEWDAFTTGVLDGQFSLVALEQAA